MEEKYQDLYYADFQGFELLEKEHRCDGHFLGRSSEYAQKKMEINQTKPRTGLTTHLSTCNVSAAILAMAHLTDAAIIDHGPRGCAFNHFLKNSFFMRNDCLTTCVNDQDAVMGGERKLREAIKLVIERSDPKPGVVFIFSTCTTSIIGDDIFGVAKALEQETGIPIIPINSAGFRHKIWNIAADESLCILVDRMKRTEEKNKGTINFINFTSAPTHYNEFMEIKPYLKALGIGLNAMVPANTTYREMIESFPRGEINVIRCSTTGLMGAEYAEKKLGIPYLRLAAPMSMTLTERWIRGLSDFFGVRDKGEALIKSQWEKWGTKIDKIRSKLKGKRMAIGCSGRKNISYAFLAAEFGMEVVYLSPLSVGPLYHDLLKNWHKDFGQDPIIISEPRVVDDDAMVKKIKPDVGLFSAQNEFQMARLGIPNIDYAIPSYYGLIGFEGAVKFGETVIAVLECGLYKRYGNYIFKHAEPATSDEFVEKYLLPEERKIR